VREQPARPKLHNGQVAQPAEQFQVRVDGTATNQGAKFRVYRNGAEMANSPSPNTTAYAAEFRTAYGNFPGPGNYTVCALNKATTNTFVTLRLRSDGEF
jgi:hypothetical protein